MTGSDRCMLCHHIILPVNGVSRPLGEGLQAPWTCCSRIRPGSESLGPAEMFIGLCAALSAQRERPGAVAAFRHYRGRESEIKICALFFFCWLFVYCTQHDIYIATPTRTYVLLLLLLCTYSYYSGTRVCCWIVVINSRVHFFCCLLLLADDVCVMLSCAPPGTSYRYVYVPYTQ